MINKLLFILFLATLLVSCNEVPVSIPEYNIPNSSKNVLVEELTGVSCPNCPDGAKTVNSVQSAFPGKVIVLAIHAGDLTNPIIENNKVISKYDFRCDDGIKMEEHLKSFAKPAIAIDMIKYDEDGIANLDRDLWQSHVQTQLQEVNLVNLSATLHFDTLTRNAKLNLGIIPLENITGTSKLYIAISEDHIFDAQKFPGYTDYNYEFDNVLRDMITPWDGVLISENLIKNTVVTKIFDFTIPKSDGTWIPKNLKCVIFFTNDSLHGYETVRNVIEVKFIK